MDNETNRVYIDWLKSHIPMVSAYHNHKETMAWVATALYLPTIVGLGHIVGSGNPCIIIKSALSLIVFAAGVVFLCLFINMQFTQRWSASDRIAGLMKALVKLLADEVELTTKNRRKFDAIGTAWPQFIAEEIRKSLTQRSWKKALLLLFSLRWHKLDERWRTELASYIMIIGSSVVAILFIWT